MVRPSNVRRFVHLRVHSTYSLGVGLSSPADVCVFAHRAGYDTVALTDINGTYGYVAFHHAARSLGIKPIYGTLIVVDSRIDDRAPPDERHALTLLALDRTGLRNVCRAASVSASRREDGESVHVSDLHGLGDGVVCIVGLPSTVRSVLPRTSRSVLVGLRSEFRDRLYVESLAHVAPAQAESRGQLEMLAQTLHIRPVLCQDVRFVGQEKHELIDLIGTADDAGTDPAPPVADEPDRGTHGMLTPDEMSNFFDRDQEAYTNASLIAASVQPDILAALGTSDRSLKHLPNLDTEDAVETFKVRVRAAFDREFAGVDDAEREMWKRRLDEEIEIVIGVELEDTFLQFEQIVAGVRREAGRPGPATGLRLQSLCAYLLGITAFNPYTVDAHFHPFFDERERANHILDLQLPSGTRSGANRVIDSLFDESGLGYVPSVEHITAARALRMVAGHLLHRPDEFDEVVRIASHSPGATLQELCTQNRRVGYLYKRSAVLREAISHAAAIEGLPYGFVRSRRTLIVSPTPLGEFLGSTANEDKGERFVQSTRDSFPIGSISRIDITSLAALAVCARLGVGEAIPWEDMIAAPDIYRCIEAGEVDGVYLLETELIQRLAREFKIASFHDLLCFLALMRYRRGGTSLAERVAAYRSERGERASMPVAIASILDATNRWVLFHDQLRDMVTAVTGLDPLNAAQMVRRFARHRPAELATLRREFMMFAVERGTEMDVASQTFTRILRAADSTVSRQQIIADALIVCAMLYFSKRQKIPYFVELVNVHRDNEARRVAYLERVREFAPVLPVDINRSGVDYVVEDTGVRPPLWTVKGVGEESARKIVRARGGQKVWNAQEFDCLIDDSGITYKIVEALVGAGALESVGIPATAEVRRRAVKTPRAGSSRGHATNQLQFDLGVPDPDSEDPTRP